MDANFTPNGELGWHRVLDAVLREGDSAETLGLEAKSDINVSHKGIGIAKVAKFILAMANRLPEVAARKFNGHGVLVIGAERDNAAGIEGGVEAHQLEQRLRPYLGEAGPPWELGRLVLDNGREVLFVIVEPPKLGQGPFLCHQDFQPNEQIDRKHALRNGAIYVRSTTETRLARADEVKALIARGASGVTTPVNIDFSCEGPAIAVRHLDVTLTRMTSRMADEYREERKARSEGSPEADQNPGAVAARALAATMFPSPSGPVRQLSVDQAIAEWETGFRANWSKSVNQLLAAMGPPLLFIVVNRAASYLPKPQLNITVHGAYGIEQADPELVDMDELFPPVAPAFQQSPMDLYLPRTQIRMPHIAKDIDWRNGSDALHIELTPAALRPHTPWELDLSELIVVSRDPEATALRVDWALTAEGLGERYTGDTTIKVKTFEELHEVAAKVNELARESGS